MPTACRITNKLHGDTWKSISRATSSRGYAEARANNTNTVATGAI